MVYIVYMVRYGDLGSAVGCFDLRFLAQKIGSPALTNRRSTRKHGMFKSSLRLRFTNGDRIWKNKCGICINKQKQ